MDDKLGQLNIGLILTLVVLIILGIFMADIIVKSPLATSLTISLGIMIFIIGFANTEAALYILIVSMLLSPEMKVAEIPGRDVVVRFDDLLIIIISFAWLARMAMNKELGLFTVTSLNRPIAAYIAICFLSTALGVLFGSVVPAKGIFYTLRYTEYFLLYFLVVNHLRSKEQIKRLTFVLLLTCACISIYAALQIPLGGRVSAPFEGRHGEPNTLGGYLILLFALAMGLFVYSSGKTRFWTGALAISIIPPLLYTLSRTSFIAFIPMYLALIFLGKRRRILLVVLLILAIGLAWVTLPAIVTQRVTKTFEAAGVPYNIGPLSFSLDRSASGRLESWDAILRVLPDRPFLGFGITGVGLVDSQYPRVLGELGIVGFVVFLWLLTTIFKRGLESLEKVEDNFAKGVSLGFLSGFVGLIFHFFGANSFIILRIMEPFWFMAAIVMVLPRIYSEKEAG